MSGGRGWGVALLLAAVLAWGSTAAAQERPTSWSGIDGWVMLLQQRGVPFRGEEELARLGDHTGTLLILFGRPPADAGFPERVRRHVVLQRAPLLIASDLPEMNPVLEVFGAQLRAGSYRALDPAARHHEYADCPLVTPEHGFDPLFRRVTRLALNRPAWFTNLRWPVAAWLPEGVDRQGEDLPCMLVAAEHKAVLISDHSLFINLMLPEESNLRFANNLIDWLRPRRVLFLYDGKVVKPVPLPFGLPDLGSRVSVRVLDRVLREAEESGLFRTLDPRIYAGLTAALGVGLAAVLAVWILRRPSRLPEVLARSGALLTEFGPGAPGNFVERNLRIPAEEYLLAWWKRFRARQGLGAEVPLDPTRWEIRGGSACRRRAFRRDLALLVATTAGRGRVDPTAFRRLVETARRCDEAKDIQVAAPEAPIA